MELKSYYRKIRDLEASIQEQDVVVVSHETPDGGRAGTRTETPRHLAARMIVEGKARLATEEEAQEFRTQLQEAKRAADEAATAARIQVAIVSESDVRPSKSASKATKRERTG